MKASTRIAFAEVDRILSLLEEEYVELIPKELRYIFNTQKDKNYMKAIDINKPLSEQNLNKETIAIITLLNYEYWCKTEKEKNLLAKQLCQNDFKEEKRLRAKYNPENLFKEEKERLNKIVEETKKEMLLINEQNKKESFILKLVKKIKNFFTNFNKVK